ncbi:MAG: putative membrane protein [Reinekea sp.]|jgi:uncharacterized membrane protein
MLFVPKNTKSACVVALCLGLASCVAATPPLVSRGLSCYGTEPFWALDFGTTGAANWSEPNFDGGPIIEESYAITQLSSSPPFQQNAPTAFLLDNGLQGVVTPMTAPNLCSDGMRTDQNPFSILISALGQQGAGTNLSAPVNGCCFWTDAPIDPE